MDEVRHTIDREIKLSQFKTDQWVPYKLTKKVEWVSEVLSELATSQSENIDDSYGSGDDENIEVELKILRKSIPTYKDHLLIDGKIKANYNAACIKCLVPTRVDIDFEFNTIHINSALEDDPQFEEVDELYAENAERELNFYSKGIIPLGETLREFLLAGIAPFPTHSEDCKGLCLTCGINLNHDSCSHNNHA